MRAKILEGRPVAAEVLGQVSKDVETLKERGITPTLAVVLVGNDAGSQVYVANKEKKAHELGLGTREFKLTAYTGENELLKLVETLNADPQVHGILVQFPLPAHISERAVRQAIAPHKDVDGLHPLNQGKLLDGQEGLIPCTPAGILKMLDHYKIDVAGKNAVVVGRSALVGKPIAQLLLNRNATVTQCHSKTQDLGAWTRQADILVVAVGKPALITSDMVKPGATVIDVGINRLAPQRHKEGEKPAASTLQGDVDFEGVEKVAGAITPVPGGVGLMTIAMLMHNTVKACLLQLNELDLD